MRQGTLDLKYVVQTANILPKLRFRYDCLLSCAVDISYQEGAKLLIATHLKNPLNSENFLSSNCQIQISEQTSLTICFPQYVSKKISGQSKTRFQKHTRESKQLNRFILRSSRIDDRDGKKCISHFTEIVFKCSSIGNVATCSVKFPVVNCLMIRQNV